MVFTGIADEGPQWHDRADRESVPPEQWGKSHWSLLGYVDERVVNWHGKLDWDQLSVSRKYWPMLYAARRTAQYGFAPSKDGSEYGLLLKPDEHGRAVVLPDHCDVDALMDLVDYKLVTLQMPQVSSSGKSYLRPDGHALNDPTPNGLVTGHVEWLLMPWAKFGMTELGWSVSAALRRHKGAGLKFADFEPPGMTLAAKGDEV
jgi:hypothetical protein